MLLGATGMNGLIQEKNRNFFIYKVSAANNSRESRGMREKDQCVSVTKVSSLVPVKHTNGWTNLVLSLSQKLY